MVWLGVAWHLLALSFGALADLPATPATPAALAVGLAVALLAVAVIRRSPAVLPTHRATVPAGRSGHAPPPAVRAIDPDAPGRSRPRAPSPAA
jgi:hypothetical protein